MTEAALSHKLASWKVRLIGARMPQMNGRFDDVFGRFFYKNQCSTIITTGEPSSVIWAVVDFARAVCRCLLVRSCDMPSQQYLATPTATNTPDFLYISGYRAFTTRSTAEPASGSTRRSADGPALPLYISLHRRETPETTGS